MILGFGKNKSSSSSTSSANTYVDPTQQPFRRDLMNQAQGLNNQGMPVEGVAGINPNLANALNNQYMGGNMQAGAGAGLMGSGSALAGGSMSALNFANQAMNTGGYSPRGGAGINTAFGAGNRYAGGVAQGDIAQGSGVDFNMAGNMANSASTADAANMNAATNAGFNQNNLSNYINNDVLQGQIDAASRDITRNLQQNTLPSIQGQAAGSGNSGSSRVGNMMGTAMGMANESIGDISANMRGSAYNQALGIESNRAAQNAGFQQGANQANAGFIQQANQFNAGAQNNLLGQGYGIGASQLESNLGRQQQGGQFNAGSFNDARNFGSRLGADAFNNNMMNQQFGATLAARLGAQGTSDMQAGAGMFNTGVGQQLSSGQYGRDYEQQLYNRDFRQGMAPFNSLNFYNQIVGAPNNLSSSTTTSKGKSSGFNFSI